MYNRRVKFGLKIRNRLGKNVRKPHGVFFDSLYKCAEILFIWEHLISSRWCVLCIYLSLL